MAYAELQVWHHFSEPTDFYRGLTVDGNWPFGLANRNQIQLLADDDLPNFVAHLVEGAGGELE